VRVDVKRAAVSLVPLANGGTRIAAVVHMDPKLDNFPAWCTSPSLPPYQPGVHSAARCLHACMRWFEPGKGCERERRACYDKKPCECATS